LRTKSAENFHSKSCLQKPVTHTFQSFPWSKQPDKCQQPGMIVEDIGRLFFKWLYHAHLCIVYINLHTHHPTLLPGVLEVESVYFGQNKTPATSIRSVGLHPWYLEGLDLDLATNWLHEQAAMPSTRAIGEAGLDKICKTPWDLQLIAFQRCSEVSELAGKPLIIHCVRAFSEIISLKKAWNPKQKWIFHGFNKNLTTATMLLRAGCSLSYGAALLRENSPVLEGFRAVPEDRLFLETDDAELSIEAVYERAAILRGMSIKALEGVIARNFSLLF